MSVRLYIDSALTRHANSGGSNFFLIDGEKVHFHVEAGTPYIYTSINALVHPSLTRHVKKATFQRRLDDPAHIAIIETGAYEHGTFRAEVTKNFDGSRQSKWTMEISAEAPTVSMLKRFIRPLLAGEDKPTRAYSKKATQPSAPAN